MLEALREPVDSEKVDWTEGGKPGESEVRKDCGRRSRERESLRPQMYLGPFVLYTEKPEFTEEARRLGCVWQAGVQTRCWKVRTAHFSVQL